MGFFLSSCSTGSSLGYLWQAGKGQLRICNRAKPISEVIQSPLTSPMWKGLLAEVPNLKRFAESRGLKATRNYEEFARVDGEAVNWVVTASQELKFQPKIWSFPIAGSFNYLGWFDRKDAENHARSLKQEGWEVYVRGARAYSTLGWFRDPILSTMVMEGEEGIPILANMVFHESTHATLYLKDQLPFNESLADFVAEQMTSEFLRSRGDEMALTHYQERRKRGEAREALYHKAYVELDSLYRSTLSDAEKRVKKKVVLERLQKEVGAKEPINNAVLIQFKTYSAEPEGFQKIWESTHANWETFWKIMNRVSEKDFSRPQQEDVSALLLRLRDP